MAYAFAKSNRNCACAKQDIVAEVVAFTAYGHAAIYRCRLCRQIVGWKSLDMRENDDRDLAEEIRNENS